MPVQNLGKPKFPNGQQNRHKWPVPGTLHYIMDFMGLHNARVDLYNGHVAQVRSATV